MNLESVPAIVTGGASGLGAAVVRKLTERGANVAVFDLNEVEGRKIASETGALFKSVNVANDESAAEAIDWVSREIGVARILVNCAGVAPAIRTVGREAKPHPLDAFRKTIDVNLVGTFNVISKFAAPLSHLDTDAEERGVIVNTASVAAFDGQIGQAAYAASKAGVAGMTLPIARDLAAHRIRVVTVAPGIFLTPMLMGLPQAARDSLGQQVPHPSRLGKPEEFAQLVANIIDNPMLNGEVIRLDGAMRMGPK